MEKRIKELEKAVRDLSEANALLAERLNRTQEALGMTIKATMSVVRRNPGRQQLVDAGEKIHGGSKE